MEPKHHDSTKADIAKYFLEEQQGLLQYGQYAARLPQALEKVSVGCPMCLAGVFTETLRSLPGQAAAEPS